MINFQITVVCISSSNNNFEQQQNDSLRDQYLKNVYQKQGNKGVLEADEDLDEKLKNVNLGFLSEEKSSDVQPYRERT